MHRLRHRQHGTRTLAHATRGLQSEMLGESSLVAAAQAQHQVERRLLLDVVVRQGAPVLQLLAREDQTLLVGRDALLVLDLGLDVLNRVRGLNLQGDGLSRQCLNENLRPVAQLACEPSA